MFFCSALFCKQEKDLFLCRAGQLSPHELYGDFLHFSKNLSRSPPQSTRGVGPSEGTNTTGQPELARLALQVEEAAARGSISLSNHSLPLQVPQSLLTSHPRPLPSDHTAKCSQQCLIPAVMGKEQTALLVDLLCTGGHFGKEKGAAIISWVSSRREQAHLQEVQS